MKSKISAMLTSAMMIMCSMNSTASDLSLIDQVIWVNGEPISFEEYLETCTPDEYRVEVGNILRRFVWSENLNAQVLFDEASCDYVNEKGEKIILINYYYTHTNVQPAVEAFIEENNFDSDIIVYHPVGNEETNTNDKITDHYEILALIYDFINSEDCPHKCYCGISESSITPEIAVYAYYDEADEVTEAINTFVNEMNIDEEMINVETLESVIETENIMCDADGDNELTVRDCSFIALTIAQGRNDELSDSADFNKDGEVNVRDAAAIAKSLAQITT